MSVTICPVPPDQRPINEFQALQESWFFGWSRIENQNFWRLIILFWVLPWSISGPVAASSFPWEDYPLVWVLTAAAGANVGISLIILRLYLGWGYVGKRLWGETVIYEETGWYDCQAWEKPPEELAKDRLIVTYQVNPIMQRLGRLLLGFGAVTLTEIGLVFWLYP